MSPRDREADDLVSVPVEILSVSFRGSRALVRMDQDMLVEDAPSRTFSVIVPHDFAHEVARMLADTENDDDHVVAATLTIAVGEESIVEQVAKWIEGIRSPTLDTRTLVECLRDGSWRRP